MPGMLVLSGILALGVAAAALAWGARRWRTDTRGLRQRLEAERRPPQPRRVDFAELAGLPLPVQRYLRTVLKDGQPLVAAVDVEHRGSFDMGRTRPRWTPFTSTQRVIARRPGFDWDARIRLLPGLAVRVHDAYVGGEGILHASLGGLFSVAELRGGGDIAAGELMRFLAEAAWYPTALLPSQGVRWEAVDTDAARATLADGAVGVSLLFRFGADGLIESATATARGRSVDGRLVPTPWQGRFWNYAERGGMRVPLEGEVAWLMSGGEAPYWRGRITRIEYESDA